MFYFTNNESRKYESSFSLFHDIQIFWDTPVYLSNISVKLKK